MSALPAKLGCPIKDISIPYGKEMGVTVVNSLDELGKVVK